MTNSYTCHAHPPALNGKECGHFNQSPSQYGFNKLTCCDSCGCTKIASDSRLKRKNKEKS